MTYFSDQFHNRIGYDLNVMRQSACSVINPVTVDNFAALFNCTPVDGDGPDLKLLISDRWDRSSFVCCLVRRGATDGLLLLSIGVVWQTRDLHLSCNTLYLLSPRLCFFVVLKRALCVYPNDSLTSKMLIMRTEQPTKCFVPLKKLMVRLST